MALRRDTAKARTPAWITAVALAMLVCGPASCAAPGRDAPSSSLLDQRLRLSPVVRSVSGWEYGAEQGRQIRTAHYHIYTTLSDPLYVGVPAFMEASYKAYRDLVPDLKVPEDPMVVYIFRTREQWERFTRRWTGALADRYLKIRSGAYYANGASVAYDIGRYATLSVLAHEGFHQFVAHAFALRLPAWLDEGLATTFEVYEWRSGSEAVFLPDRNMSRLASLRKVLATGRAIPIKTLVTTHAGEVLGLENQEVGAFYGQCYGLVRLLQAGSYFKYSQNFKAMLLAIAEGRLALPEAVLRGGRVKQTNPSTRYNAAVGAFVIEQFISTDWDRLQSEYMAYLRDITRSAGTVRALGR